jgi:hypothetical protein
MRKMGLFLIINFKLCMQVYEIIFFITQDSSKVLDKSSYFTLRGGSQNFSKRTAVNISFHKVQFKTFKHNCTNSPGVLAVCIET